MATVPSGQKFHTVASTVVTNNLGSALANSQREIFTMDDITSTVRPYKVFTALLTQSGGDDPQVICSGSVTKGITYRVDGDSLGGDFSNVGGPVNPNNNVYFVATQDGTPISYGSSCLEYNTGAPVATVLENTIGNIWFSYAAAGFYVLNSLDLFTNKKTFALYTPSTLGNFNVLATQIDSINQVIIDCYDSTLTEADNLLVNTPIEIRVYE